MGPGTSMQFCAAQAPEGTAVSELEQCDWDGDVDWPDLPERKCSGKDATQTQYTPLRAVSQTGQNDGGKGRWDSLSILNWSDLDHPFVC